MKKLFLTVFLIGFFLLLGALSGVQYMNEELGLSEPKPLTLVNKQGENEESKADISELIDKKERIEEVGSFNFFSDLGNFVADHVYEMSRSLLTQLMSFVHHVLNGEPKK